MTTVLWRGTWATRIRIASGLVLMTYVTLHLLNISAVLISPDVAEAFQRARLAVTRTDAGETVMGLALLAHLVLSLWKVVARRTWRMPLVDYAQIGLGLAIPLLLSSHVIFTHIAHQAIGVDTRIGYLVSLIWGTSAGWTQATLLLVVWTHGVIGLNMWLRSAPWWPRALPWFVAIVVMIPTLTLLGYVTAGRAITGLLTDPRARDLAYDVWGFPDDQGFDYLNMVDGRTDGVILGLMGALALIVVIRRGVAAIRKPVRVTYVDGPIVRAARNQTVLETSQEAGVEHTALCGGRGRCTTCRVIVEEGGENLGPPSAAELRSLKAVDAAPGTRLACQMRPTGPVTVFRVFRADGKRSRAHASQGQEAQLAILFLDMRGFTARTDGQLPYDVVFLLNRFFDQIVPPINKAGGTVDKYLGDGLLAVFEQDSPAASARAALAAVEGVGTALEAFNATLTAEGSRPVAIGMGVHLGNVVLGEIGAAGQAPRTLIGDAVNTASRLEGQTKELEVEALISQDALNAAGASVPEAEMVALSLRGRDSLLPSLPVKDASQLRDVLRKLGQAVPA